ncbi:Dabb family protein [Engelhardtia mirabilis]|uniref:Stress responsive A/B Barrel Domain protein n=1 Tax=Engelhardtia mirabilis TaxID=2528011 RepID=A0A518BN55_9BACT|nr:Stress responsive A/B Barrel Domain protein [Planctomycetes bacterium Pla133]QDV02733.1 Stress responsive A/B Barrel Domain protein [Planctomycetes bacterium Pla86]
MGTLRRLLPALVLSACLGSCLSPGGDSGAVDGRVEHVVLCWLAEPASDEARQKVIEASRELTVIPEVLSITVGTPLASDREVVDDSFDIGLVITFRSAGDLAVYLDHPEHVRRVQEVLGPLTERILVYDIIDR